MISETLNHNDNIIQCQLETLTDYNGVLSEAFFVSGKQNQKKKKKEARK